MGKKPRPEIPPIYLGDWLEFFEIGPSQAAQIAGCSQSYISNIMAGRKANINSLYLFRISEHCGINVNDFYRPLPGRAQLETLKSLSGKARTAILNKRVG